MGANGPWSKYGGILPDDMTPQVGGSPAPPIANMGKPWEKYANPQGSVSQAPREPEGFFSALGSDLLDMAKSLPKSLVLSSPAAAPYVAIKKAIDDYKSFKATGKTPQQLEDESRKQAGYGIATRLLAPAAEGLGVNVQGMEQAAAEGDTAGVLGHAAAVPTAMAVTAGLSKGAGAVAAKLAPEAAESSLGIGTQARAYGKTPGVAALEETSGLRPATVLASTREAMNNIGQQIASEYQAAGQAGARVSIQPALDILEKERQKALAQGRPDYAADIAKNQDRLTTDYAKIDQMEQAKKAAIQQGNTQLASVIQSQQDQVRATPRVTMSPEDLWKLKQGQGDTTNWNPNTDPRQIVKLNRAVYRAMDDELDRAAPATSDLNQTYSSLREVAKRADIESRGASIAQSAMNRIARPTGALASAIFGGVEGSRLGGPTGGIIGATAGLLAPEVVASPTTQMGLARALWTVGKMKNVPTAALSTASVAGMSQAEAERLRNALVNEAKTRLNGQLSDREQKLLDAAVSVLGGK